MVKILHYCWFGGNPLPEATLKFMETWKKFCPDFEIKRWDESNFPVDDHPFTKEAYRLKRWAFVSDYVRTYALFTEGGLYVDTDVEFIKPIDDVLKTSFAGFEEKNLINPGLILYARENNEEFYGKVLEKYDSLTYKDEIKSDIASPKIYSKTAEECGFTLDNTLQTKNGLTLYPMEYFQPYGANKKTKPTITENTRTIHHYDATWYDKDERELFNLKRKYGETFGKVVFSVKHPVKAIKKAGIKKNNKQKRK